MRSSFSEVRQVLRGLARNPGLSALVVITLAVGIAGNLVAFVAIRGIVRPAMDAPGVERLHWIDQAMGSESQVPLSHPAWVDVERETGDVFEASAAFRLFGTSVRTPDRTFHSWAHGVSGGYFPLFGAKPAAGRLFGPDDDRPGAPPVLVLSHLYWVEKFDRDPGVIGQSFLLDGRHAYTVVGVAPQGFQGQGIWTGIYVPLATSGAMVPGLDDRSNRMLLSFVRLADGVNPAAVEARLSQVAGMLDEASPEDEARSLSLRSVNQPDAFALEMPVVKAGRVMAGATALLLVLGCANVANLMLARGTARSRELGVKAALGAGRFRLAARLALESLVLAGLGGGLGLLLARGGKRLVEGYLRQELPISMGDFSAGTSLAVDDTVLVLVLFSISLLAGLLFGTAPVCQVLRTDLVTALKGEARKPGRRLGVRDLLLVAQVAIAVTLLIGAGLFVRTLVHLKGNDPGFDERNLFLASLFIPQGRGAGEEGARLYQEIGERLERLPEVQSASLVLRIPMSFVSTMEGTVPASGEEIDVAWNVVGPGYFETLGVPMIEGRAIDHRDRRDERAVAVVSAEAARRYWPDHSAVGQRLELRDPRRGGDPWEVEVVGVVADFMDQAPWQPDSAPVYLAFPQRIHPRMTLVLRAPSSVSRAVHDLLRRDFPEIAILGIAPFEEQARRALADQRLFGDLSSGLALVGLLIAAFGVFSSMSYLVTEKRRELGIRSAVGGDRSVLLAWVLRLAASRVALGLGLGLAAAALLSRLLASVLVGVGPFDPLTFAVVPAVLVAAGLSAAWLPARRAARVSPSEVLRDG